MPCCRGGKYEVNNKERKGGFEMRERKIGNDQWAKERCRQPGREQNGKEDYKRKRTDVFEESTTFASNSKLGLPTSNC